MQKVSRTITVHVIRGSLLQLIDPKTLKADVMPLPDLIRYGGNMDEKRAVSEYVKDMGIPASKVIITDIESTDKTYEMPIEQFIAMSLIAQAAPPPEVDPNVPLDDPQTPTAPQPSAAAGGEDPLNL